MMLNAAQIKQIHDQRHHDALETNAKSAARMNTSEHEPYRRFLYKVREVVTPRLTSPEMRDRVGIVPIFFGGYLDYPDRHLSELVEFGMRGRGPFGETNHFWKDERAYNIIIYSDPYRGTKGIALPPNIPTGRILAFSLIHELGHAALLGGGNQHEDCVWARACQEMGIAEMRYSQKPGDWPYAFDFTDQALWEQIRALPSYPGDNFRC